MKQLITIDEMLYVVQCYISDVKGQVVRITRDNLNGLDRAYKVACEYYGETLINVRPDNGRFSDYVS